MHNAIFEYNNYQIISSHCTFTLLENSVPKLTDIISYKQHNNYLYLLTNTLYKLDLSTNELTLLYKSVSSFDSTQDCLAIGLKSGKLIYQTQSNSFNFHWHNLPINHTVISNTSNIIATASNNPVIVLYNVKTKEPRFVLFYGFVTTMSFNSNFLIVKSQNLTMNYDMKNEQFKYLINPEKYKIWIARSAEENFVLDDKSDSNAFKAINQQIRSTGVFENSELPKYKKVNFTPKKRFLVFQDQNLLVIYDGSFIYKNISGLKSFYCSNFLFCNSENTLKIFDSNFVLVDEVIFSSEFTSMVYLNKILYFVNDNSLFKGIVYDRKVFISKCEENVKQVFVFRDNLYKIYLDGKCTFKCYDNVDYELNGVLYTRNGAIGLEVDGETELVVWDDNIQDFKCLIER